MNKMTQMTKRFLLLLAALGSATVLAACGGDQPTATNTMEEPATEQASEPMEVPATPETTATTQEVDPATGAVATDDTDTAVTPTAATTGNTIVDIASENSTFSTLVAAIEAADLADVLSGPGPFTVFAPTDEAFAALPEGTVEELLQPENKDQLVQVLKNHVVPAKVMSTEIQAGMVETVEGEALQISLDPDTNEVLVNNAKVVTTDIVGSNGVIHAVDTVILPAQ